jgi:hypothetical protein
MDIVQLVNSYDSDKLKELLGSQLFVLRHLLRGTPEEGNVNLHTYLDHCFHWNEPWMRQSRGTIMAKLGTWKILRMALQRGAEMVTGVHIKENIQGENRQNSRFDANQFSTMEALKNEEVMNAHLSNKFDGNMLNAP